MTDVVTEDIQMFDPNLQVPYADTWSAGWQRSISRNMAVEVRYVGTRARDLWTTYNINEVNIHENGFFEEFKLAQQNLQANIAQGRGTNFRYFGPNTGTSPLPIYLAYFSGRTDATTVAAYSSGNFASSTFYNPLRTFGDRLAPRQPRRRRRAAAERAQRRSRATSSSPIRDKLGGADIGGHGEIPATTACSSSCDAAWPRASSSRPATPTAAATSRTSIRSASRASTCSTRAKKVASPMP
jgi:hypothetical protein